MWKKFKSLKLSLKIIVGIIAIIFLPVTLLLLSIEWLIKNIKACDKKRMAAVMAILIESFFLVNYRQPFFWYILVYSSSLGLVYSECRK